MAAKDKAFYEQLGRRLAEARRTAGITQVELAKTLGIAQQTLAHYEGGVSRLPVALLPAVAKAVGASTDTLLGEEIKRTASKRGRASKLQQQLDQVTQLPKTQQKFVMQMLETVLAQASR
ncbi:MAG: helix-turn-helix domain-containing protein [Pseudomonadota bacterium]